MAYVPPSSSTMTGCGVIGRLSSTCCSVSGVAVTVSLTSDEVTVKV